MSKYVICVILRGCTCEPISEVWKPSVSSGNILSTQWMDTPVGDRSGSGSVEGALTAMEGDDVGEHVVGSLVVSTVEVEFGELAVGFNNLGCDSKFCLLGELGDVPLSCVEEFVLSEEYM